MVLIPLQRTPGPLLVLLLLCLFAAPAKPVQADPATDFARYLTGRKGVRLIHARILPMTGDRTTGLIAEGWLDVGADGRILALGPMSSQPRTSSPTLDCEGRWLTPGLIDANTILGLSGHPVTGITQEQNENSERSLPQLRVIDGINPLDRAIPRVRASGITTVYVNPGEETLISGQGALIKLRPSANIADLVLKAPAALHLNLGEAPKNTWGGKGGPGTRMGSAAVLRMELTAARNWLRGSEKHVREQAQYEAKVAKLGEGEEPPMPPAPRDIDLKKQVLAAALQGDLPVICSAHRQDDILTALRITSEFGIRPILLHATAAWQILPEIGDAQVPLLLGPIRTGPNTFETAAARLDNAALVAAAGLPFAIQTSGALNVRALPHEAAWAVSGGLPADLALLAITRYPAEIFGVADRIGSLTPGLAADLVLWDGHPLETKSRARYVIIEGQLVNDAALFEPFPDGPGW